MLNEDNPIKILIPLHILPEHTSFHTIYFENVLSELRKKIPVHVIWLIYMPEEQESHNDKNLTVTDIHQYDNALEVINKTKPDLIFAYAGGPQGQIHYSLSLAAKSLDIPVISLMTIDRELQIKRSKYLKANLIRFFESSNNLENNKKKKMGKGKFFIYKTFFLIKTLTVLNKSKIEILKIIFLLIKSFFSITHSFDSRYANTMHLLDDDNLLEPLIQAGFDKSSLVVTGNPLYDKAFKRIQKFHYNKTSDKIQILLMTSPVVEHGRWTKQERNSAIEKIIKNFTQFSNEMNLTIKIHPTNENFSEYLEIIERMKVKIPLYKDGDIIDYLENSDVVITYDSETTAAIFALIAKKPIVICNFYNVKKDRFLERGLAAECNNPEKIMNVIKKVVAENPASDQKIEKFVKDVLFKSDGMAGERIASSLIDLIKTKN